MKTFLPKECVVHGMRHAFRDRLRAVNAPMDMIDQLGGWNLRSVGQGYGDGYSLKAICKSYEALQLLNSELVFSHCNKRVQKSRWIHLHFAPIIEAKTGSLQAWFCSCSSGVITPDWQGSQCSPPNPLSKGFANNNIDVMSV